MSSLYRDALPQLNGSLFVTDGEIETTLIFHQGLELPDFAGQPLADAIGQVDAATGSYPAYYMLNCAHPEHFDSVLEPDASWTARVRGLRANASRKSHAELNESPELDMGDPAELGRQYAEFKQRRLPRLNVLGGCCGTDHRHVESIAAACAPLFRHALR